MSNGNNVLPLLT